MLKILPCAILLQPFAPIDVHFRALGSKLNHGIDFGG
jgi:hypothetical protein